jgi:hypothetical protein
MTIDRPMQLQVDTIIQRTGHAIAVSVGQDTDTGKRTAFCGDHRMMLHLHSVLVSTGKPVRAEVEGWQILGAAHDSNI